MHSLLIGGISASLMVAVGVGVAPRICADSPINTDGVQVVFQTGHSARIKAVALSRDGRFILSAAADETVKLWDVASGQEIRTLAGLTNTIGVSFNDDGSRIIVSEMTGISVFAAASGLKLVAPRAQSAAFTPLVSSDGRIGVEGPAAGAAARSPRVIDLISGEPIWQIPVQGLSESAIALSGDGKTLLTHSIGQMHSGLFSRTNYQVTDELHVWDVTARKLRSTLSMQVDGAENTQVMRLSPDGAQLVTVSQNGSLSFIDLATSKAVLNIPTAGTGASSLLYSADGTQIAVTSWDGHSKIWGLPSGRVITSLDSSAVNFSSDGTTLVLGGAFGGAPALQKLSSGVQTSLAGGIQPVSDLAVFPDGRTLAAAMMGGGVKIWDLSSAQLTHTFNCTSGAAAVSVTVSSAAPLLAIGCTDTTATLWNMKTDERVLDIPAPQPGLFDFTQVRFSPNGRVLAVSVRDTVSVIDAESGKTIRQLKLPPGARPLLPAGTSDTVSPEILQRMPPSMRKRFEAAQAARQDPSRIALMDAAMNGIRSVAIHPDGRLLAVARTYEIDLWDADTGQRVRRFGEIASAGIPAATAEDSEDEAVEEASGAVSLSFSPDGRELLSLGDHHRLWDVATGREILGSRAASSVTQDPRSTARRMRGETDDDGQGTAFSPDGRIAAHGNGSVVKITDLSSGNDVAQLRGHTSNVSSLAFAAAGRLLLSGGHDGSLRVWSMPDGVEVASLIALGRSDYVAVTPDQYYRASKSRISGVAFRVRDQIYPFEQFDLRFNRPDIIMQRIGVADAQALQTYAHAYERRLAKMGISEAMLGRDFHLPEVALLNGDVPVSTAAASLMLKVRASDDKYSLDRINVFVNDVPVYGTAGLSVAAKDVHQSDQTITVPLVAGRNKVQVSALNAQGTESLKQTVYTTSTADQGPADVYVVAIGVSQYKNSAYNLRYAAKDAGDFLAAYKSAGERPAPHGVVHLLEMTNGKATREGIRAAKQFLKQARVNDLVVVFAAGHGMTDRKQNYYFGTWDIDPAHPDLSGLPYEEFENLLDGIPALQKMLLIDTCFSGEIDKNEPSVIAQASGGDGTIKMRAFKPERGISVITGADLPDTAQSAGTLARIQQDWFADLRRGTGAVVISSASGNEYAFEGEQWHNGVFTYALLNGLKNGAADLNRDGVITVGELQSYVIDQVRKLTDGGQNPTVRRENLDYDFAVY